MGRSSRSKQRPLLFRQIYALVFKNIQIALVRHPLTTILRAFILPLVFGWFLS